ncbi:MAG TPA: sulfatase [Acidobacteriota bacterium]|nr:sulfatase [Acidobacteriota bacterium]HRV07020.1 sulfatase [Acidobacteriota bacterium]
MNIPYRRFLLLLIVSFGFGGCRPEEPQSPPILPNFVVILADDLGYGDLGVFGHPTIRTPNLDRLATEGQKWTNFYAAASVCTPSRAALLTGRLPVRNGMMSPVHRVLYPDSRGGLPASEITIAEALKTRDYATACIGKWHLGHLPPYLPTRHGFDSYFGIPYSNDMDRVPGRPVREVFLQPRIEDFNVPLMRDATIVERPADQRTITRRYTDEAVRFIEENRDRPFFLYLAHNFPHVPLFASDDFLGKSRRGLYGDVVEEIDYGVGRVVARLQELGIAENTLVVFTSDNGPWLTFAQHGGSAGLLREGKGTTWEGGMREPTVFWWPGRLRPGTVLEMGSTLDLMNTFCSLAGVSVPTDRQMDGYDLSPVLFGTGESPRQAMFFYRESKLYAVRHGQFKAHFITKPVYTGTREEETHHDPPLLFHLGEDPEEQYDISSQHPEVIERIKEIVQAHEADMVMGEDQLAKR